MSTKFLDGPAKGVVLELQRAPPFLRVTLSNDHDRWDALDLLTDTQETGEFIFAYRRVADDGWIHLDYTEKKSGRRRGRTIHSATYAVLEIQPPEDVLRDTAKWREFCTAEKARGR